MSNYNKTFVVSTISNQYQMAFEKYSFARRNIEFKYYEADQTCLEKPKNIVSKISEKDILAIAWSTNSNIYLRHFNLRQEKTIGEHIVVNSNSNKLFLDTQNMTSVLGWAELTDKCVAESDYIYKAQMFNIYGHNKGPIIEFNHIYNSKLLDISLLNNSTFSALLQSDSEFVIRLYRNSGDEIFAQYQFLSCSDIDSHSSRRSYYVQDSGSHIPITYSKFFLSPSPLCNKEIKSLLEPIVVLAASLSSLLLIAFLNSDDPKNKVVQLIDSKGIATQQITKQGGCKEKLIPSANSIIEVGNKPVLLYNNIGELQKTILYQSLTFDNHIDLIYKTTKNTTITQDDFLSLSAVSSISTSSSIVAYSLYNVTDSIYKIFSVYLDNAKLRDNPFLIEVGDKKNITEISASAENGLFTIAAYNNQIIYGYSNNTFDIQLQMMNVEDLSTIQKSQTIPVEYAEPLLLHSKIVGDKLAFIYGSPANSKIYLQIRNVNDLSLSCSLSSPIQTNFSHISMDVYDYSKGSIIAVAWQNTYTENLNQYSKAIIQKYDGNCKELSLFYNFEIGKVNEKLESIKLIDKTFTLVTMISNNVKILKVFKNDDIWKPGGTPDNNPNYMTLVNPNYLAIDYIKRPWLHFENPNCEKSQIYTSYTDNDEINVQPYDMIRYEGNYDD